MRHSQRRSMSTEAVSRHQLRSLLSLKSQTLPCILPLGAETLTRYIVPLRSFAKGTLAHFLVQPTEGVGVALCDCLVFLSSLHQCNSWVCRWLCSCERGRMPLSWMPEGGRLTQWPPARKSGTLSGGMWPALESRWGGMWRPPTFPAPSHPRWRPSKPPSRCTSLGLANHTDIFQRTL